MIFPSPWLKWHVVVLLNAAESLRDSVNQHDEFEPFIERDFDICVCVLNHASENAATILSRAIPAGPCVAVPALHTS